MMIRLEHVTKEFAPGVEYSMSVLQLIRGRYSVSSDQTDLENQRHSDI